MSSETSVNFVMLLIPAGAADAVALGWALFTFGPAAMIKAAEDAGSYVVVTMIAGLQKIAHSKIFHYTWATVIGAPEQIQSRTHIIRLLPWNDYVSMVKHGLASLALLSSILKNTISKAISSAVGICAQLLQYGMIAMLVGNVLFMFYRNVCFAWNIVYFILLRIPRLLWAIILGILWPLRVLRSIFRH